MSEEVQIDKSIAGRPRIVFDLEIIEKLAGLGLRHEDIADWHDCTTRTIERRIAEDEEFCRAYKKGRSRLKARLRQAQLDACWSGSIPMMIWMGKQLLDQKDKTQNETDIQMKDITPTINLIAKKPDGE